MKKYLYKGLRMVVVMILVLFTVSCEKDEPELPGENQKTLFMYMPWSTNLLDYFYNNISDMENAISQMGLRNERVIVFISTSSSKATMFEIIYKDGACERKILKEYSNPPFTTEAGITSILNDVKDFAPAPVYAMMIGCHGMGWLPVNGATGRTSSAFKPHWEYTGVPLTRYFGGLTTEFQTDISTLAHGIANAGIKMEYILFDDCYMSTIEVAYELRQVTDYLIACPTEIMVFGMPYATIGKHLLGTPDYEAICNEFYQFYSTYKYPYATLGITNCSELDELAVLMKEINGRYIFDESKKGELQRMDGYSPIIFYDYGDYVTKLCNGDTDLLKRFNEQLNKVIPYKTHTKQFYSMAGGVISIQTYSGITTSEPSNRKIDWAKTSWAKATR